jgi:DNA-binding NtrC family response regulator
MPHVLIVDDDANTREALKEIVVAEGFTVTGASDIREAQSMLALRRPDVLLADICLPDGSGMDIVKDLEEREKILVVLVTGHASVDTAIDALRMGAADYLTKPSNFKRLNALLARVPRAIGAKADLDNLRSELERTGWFGSMLGSSPPMQVVYRHIEKVAPTEATVLLLGESGSGKEVAAQTIHQYSARRKHPFVAVNCGAISPNLIESEIFGHEKGSFTGADRQHKGYFERANGGTLFLDEITEMPLELQVKLLRVLETGSFMRIGSSQQIDTDVRIIAASNRDPEKAVEDGKLRLDLYHRLNVFPLMLPPLRERGQDITLLAQHFLGEMNRASGRHTSFSEAAIEEMKTSRWPGNVRELRNHVQRAYILYDDVIESVAPVAHAGTVVAEKPAGAISVPIGMPLNEVDRRLIFATLDVCGGVKKRAADMLGISLKTLYNRLEEYAQSPEQEAPISAFPDAEVSRQSTAG